MIVDVIVVVVVVVDGDGDGDGDGDVADSRRPRIAGLISLRPFALEPPCFVEFRRVAQRLFGHVAVAVNVPVAVNDNVNVNANVSAH